MQTMFVILSLAVLTGAEFAFLAHRRGWLPAAYLPGMIGFFIMVLGGFAVSAAIA